jgi:hypothetical protein
LKENDEYILDFAFICLTFFSHSETAIFHSNTPVWLILSSLNTNLSSARLARKLVYSLAVEFIAKSHHASWIHCEFTSGQIHYSKKKGIKNQHDHPAA